MPEPAPRTSTSVKVVVTGPYEVGKTTMIRTLSEVNVVSTERRLSLDSGGDDPSTMTMDFGRLTIERDLQLYLFAAPGQADYDHLWEIVREGMLGFVILFDHSRPDSLDEGAEILDYLTARGDVPYVVGVNKVQAGQDRRAVRLVRHQLRLAEDVRVVPVDVTDRDSAKAILIELFQAAREHVVSESEHAAW